MYLYTLAIDYGDGEISEHLVTDSMEKALEYQERYDKGDFSHELSENEIDTKDLRHFTNRKWSIRKVPAEGTGPLRMERPTTAEHDGTITKFIGVNKKTKETIVFQDTFYPEGLING